MTALQWAYVVGLTYAVWVGHGLGVLIAQRLTTRDPYPPTDPN